MKFYRAFSVVLLFVLNACLFITCTKEEKGSRGPNLHLISPSGNARFTSGDTLKVQAYMNDIEPIKTVFIELKDAGGSPVLNSGKLPVGSSEYLLDYNFVLDKKTLDGKFYFDITATGEHGETTVFQYIWISPQPNKLVGMFIVSGDQHKTSIYRFENGKPDLRNQVIGDFGYSAFDQENLQFLTAGKKTGDLFAFDTTGREILWSFESPNLPNVEYFRGMYFGHDGLVVSTADDRLITFYPSGEKKQDFHVDNEPYLKYVSYRSNDLFYSSAIPLVGIEEIKVLRYPSMQFKASYNLQKNQKLVAIHDLNQSEVLFLVNDTVDNLSFITRYSLIDQFPNFTNTKIGELIGQVVSIDNQTVVFTRGVNLYRYQLSTNITTLLRSNVLADVMRYDHTQNAVWIGYRENLRLISLTGTELASYALPVKIRSLELIYDY